MPLPTQKSQIEKDYLKKIHLWYGIPKIGKTTTAANFGDDENKIMFFATEPGHKFQEVFKWKTDEDKDPSKWEHWIQCVTEVAKDDMGFKCIAVDTLDNLWKWCALYTCAKHDIQHESDLGYGKGYAAIRDEFYKPMNWLTANGYGMLFLSHEATSEKKKGPRTISYTDTTLPNTCKKLVHGICDYILYFTGDDADDTKRWIITKGNDMINAGDRSGKLPPRLEMDANKLKEYLV